MNSLHRSIAPCFPVVFTARSRCCKASSPGLPECGVRNRPGRASGKRRTLAVIADPLVMVLLGAQWMGAVPVIQVLAGAGAIAAIVSNNGSAYMALGRTLILPAVLASRLAAMFALLFTLPAGLGSLGVAYAELGAYALSLLVGLPVLFRAMQISLAQYFAGFWRPAVASAVMGFLVAKTIELIGKRCRVTRYSAATARRRCCRRRRVRRAGGHTLAVIGPAARCRSICRLARAKALMGRLRPQYS